MDLQLEISGNETFFSLSTFMNPGALRDGTSTTYP